MIQLGFLYIGNYIQYESEIYRICGLSRVRNYNDVLCLNIHTNKFKWLDKDTEVEEVTYNEQ